MWVLGSAVSRVPRPPTTSVLHGVLGNAGQQPLDGASVGLSPGDLEHPLLVPGGPGGVAAVLGFVLFMGGQAATWAEEACGP